MKLKSLTVSLERSVRHRPYEISKPHVSLTADLDQDDDLRQVYEELFEDVRIMIEETVEKEIEICDSQIEDDDR